MKHILLLMIISASTLFGQVTLTKDILIIQGDSLAYGIDTLTQGYIVSPAGPNQTWDFSGLQVRLRRSEVYRPVSEGTAAASFPQATCMLRQGGVERYFRTTNTTFEELGTYTRSFTQFPGVGGTNFYRPSFVEQKVPERYLDTFQSSYKFSFTFSSDIIPDTLLNQLPLQPDSFRYTATIIVKKEVDAWGKVILPAKTWDVLRERRLTTTTAKIEAKVFSIWLDITTLAAGILGDLLNNPSITTYAYLSPSSKETIALMDADSSGVISEIQFKPNAITLASKDPTKILGLNVSPNPFTNHLVIALDGLNTGKIYHFQLVNEHGVLVHETKLKISSDEFIWSGLKNILMGTYVLIISDESGRIVGQQKTIKGQ
ncbi:MAG: hypothetical protein M3Q56_09425 [Bacteroidota bacterium]|nr:hypothetical protein [Bacteroidota bacterium]